jgi:hypothetical protein
MYRTDRNFDIKLRLKEINRRSAELSAASFELANLAAQLNHLRKENERIRIFANRRAYSSRRRDGDYLSRKHLWSSTSRLRILLSRNLADEH